MAIAASPIVNRISRFLVMAPAARIAVFIGLVSFVVSCADKEDSAAAVVRRRLFIGPLVQGLRRTSQRILNGSMAIRRDYSRDSQLRSRSRDRSPPPSISPEFDAARALSMPGVTLHRDQKIDAREECPQEFDRQFTYFCQQNYKSVI
jgi:hypothetical protein